jgi:Mn-dependent DtxR family transcriptional regulator
MIENGIVTNSDLAKEMDVTAGFISQLATKAKSAGWLKIENRKYSIIE